LRAEAISIHKTPSDRSSRAPTPSQEATVSAARSAPKSRSFFSPPLLPQGFQDFLFVFAGKGFKIFRVRVICFLRNRTRVKPAFLITCLCILPLLLDLFDYSPLHRALVISLADDRGEKRKVQTYGQLRK
jgi:hypothetical protein